jgi:hypothetical protein
MAEYMEHPNEEVRSALIRLSDALAEWERNTGRRSVLIVREQGGFVYRAQDGKPFSDEFEPTDSELVDMTLGES